MNQTGLTTGLFFTLETNGCADNTVYVTDASSEVFTLHYKNAKTFKEFEENMQKDGYRVAEFTPPHVLRF